MQMQDSCGNDLTPGLKAFLEKGSKKHQKPVTAEGTDHDEEWFGLAAGKVLNAEEMLDYKRRHRAIENCLHYVLDETFGEDKSTIKLGKNTMPLLRKCIILHGCFKWKTRRSRKAFRILLIMSVTI